jgi:hypothetical protein
MKRFISLGGCESSPVGGEGRFFFFGDWENLSGNFSVGGKRETLSDAAMTERFSTLRHVKGKMLMTPMGKVDFSKFWCFIDDAIIEDLPAIVSWRQFMKWLIVNHNL